MDSGRFWKAVRENGRLMYVILWFLSAGPTDFKWWNCREAHISVGSSCAYTRSMKLNFGSTQGERVSELDVNKARYAQIRCARFINKHSICMRFAILKSDLVEIARRSFHFHIYVAHAIFALRAVALNIERFLRHANLRITEVCAGPAWSWKRNSKWNSPIG